MWPDIFVNGVSAELTQKSSESENLYWSHTGEMYNWNIITFIYGPSTGEIPATYFSESQ